MTMDRMTTRSFGPGSNVYTRDGDHVGTVKETRPGYFKVDAAMAPDYWLRADCIASTDGDRVTLTIDKGDLGDYKVGNPDDHDADAGQTAEAMATIATTTMGTADPTSEAALGAATVAAATDGMSSPVPNDWNEWAPRYRREWESRVGASGRRWQDVEAACRYGYEMSRDPRYQGREWADAERELSTSYLGWSRSVGDQSDEGRWDRMRDDVREAWERARGR